MTSVAETLLRLRKAADAALNGFPKTTWTKVGGPGPETLTLHGSGGFEGVRLQPGTELTLRCRLELPETTEGVRLAGGPLQATLFSPYPTTLRWDGQPVF